MRIEEGREVPSTLGEYMNLCRTLGGDECDAVEFLREKIQNSWSGDDTEVVAPDSQMRAILLPRLWTRRGEPIRED